MSLCISLKLVFLLHVFVVAICNNTVLFHFISFYFRIFCASLAISFERYFCWTGLTEYSLLANSYFAREIAFNRYSHGQFSLLISLIWLLMFLHFYVIAHKVSCVCFTVTAALNNWKDSGIFPKPYNFSDYGHYDETPYSLPNPYRLLEFKNWTRKFNWKIESMESFSVSKMEHWKIWNILFHLQQDEPKHSIQMVFPWTHQVPACDEKYKD